MTAWALPRAALRSAQSDRGFDTVEWRCQRTGLLPADRSRAPRSGKKSPMVDFSRKIGRIANDKSPSVDFSGGTRRHLRPAAAESLADPGSPGAGHASPCPVLLMGDLNAAVDSPVLRSVGEGTCSPTRGSPGAVPRTPSPCRPAIPPRLWRPDRSWSTSGSTTSSSARGGGPARTRRRRPTGRRSGRRGVPLRSPRGRGRSALAWLTGRTPAGRADGPSPGRGAAGDGRRAGGAGLRRPEPRRHRPPRPGEQGHVVPALGRPRGAGAGCAGVVRPGPGGPARHQERSTRICANGLSPPAAC